MRKIYYLVSFLALLLIASCTKAELDELSPSPSLPQKKMTDGETIVDFAGDGKWDLLGFGYDITGKLVSGENASKSPIIDARRFEIDYPSRMGTFGTGGGDDEVYVGTTALDYTKEVVKKKGKGFKGGYEPVASANVDINREDANINTFSSRFSYATFESFVRVKKLYFTEDASVALLMNYLTPEFDNNVLTLDANTLLARYGTHVLLDIGIGGRLTMHYSSSIVTETDEARKSRAVKVGLGFSVLNALGINLSSDVSTTERTKIVNESRNKQWKLNFYGGTNSGRSVSFDSNGYTTETLNLSSWQQSVNVNNAGLIEVFNAIPIYEFIADPIKKSLVKTAVDNYVASKEIKEVGEVPIYSHYNAQSTDHYFTPNNQSSIGPGFVREGVSFYAHKEGAVGRVPIYVYYSSGGKDHYFTPNNSPTIGGGTFVNEGVAFYAFSGPGLGRVPIYVYHNSAVGDHYFTPDNFPSIGNGSFINEGIAFYAYPK